VWRGGPGKEGEPLRSCTILTTEPNPVTAEVHDRMPVILPASAWRAWLDADNDDLETLGKLMVPAPAKLTLMHPVSTEVNNVRNKGANLCDAVDPETLFE
jgi:putative SOS response-associated peptidase YedK